MEHADIDPVPGIAHCEMCHEGVAFIQTIAAIRDVFIIVLAIVALVAIVRSRVAF